MTKTSVIKVVSFALLLLFISFEGQTAKRTTMVGSAGIDASFTQGSLTATNTSLSQSPTIRTDFPALDVCATGTITLQVEVGGSATSVSFTGGTGTFNNYDDSHFPIIMEDYTPANSEAGTHVIITATTDDPDQAGAASTPIDLNVIAPPTASISANDAAVCTGGSTNLTFTFTGVPPFTFEYSAFDGVNSNAVGPVTVTPPGSGPDYVYTLTVGPLTTSMIYSLTSVSDNNIPDCNGYIIPGSDEVTIGIKPESILTTDFPALDVCSAGAITLQVQVGGTATAVSFTGGTGTFSNYDDSSFPIITEDYSPAFSESGSHVIITATTDVSGCGVASIPIDLNVITAPTATIGASETTVCSGGSSVLTFTFTGVPPFTFNYEIFDGVNFTAGGPMTVTPSGSGPDYVYTLPVGALTTNTSYFLKSLSDNNPEACDGYLAPGSDQVTVSVIPNASIRTDFPALDICSFGTITLQVEVGGTATSVSFTGGSGIYGNYDDSNFPIITEEYSPAFSESGNHVIITATTDVSGCGVASIPIDLNVMPVPTGTINASDQTICSGGSSVLSFTFTGMPPFTFDYEIFDGVNFIAGGSHTVTPSGSGPLYVYTLPVGPLTTNTSYYLTSLTDNNPDACNGYIVPGSDQVSISINPDATIRTDFPALDVCSTGSITLQVEVGGTAASASFTGGTGTYNNYDDSNFPIITEDYSPALSETGNHVIITATTDVSGCGVASIPIDLNVVAAPTATISASQSTVCSGGSSVLSFGFTGVPPFTFDYEIFDGVNFIAGGSHTVTPSGSGPQYVYTLPVGPFTTTTSYFLTSLSDNNPEACDGYLVPDSDQVSITLAPDPIADIVNHDNTTLLTCTQTSISVTATGGISYLWNGGTSPATADNSFTSPGTYTVTVTTTYGCTDSKSIVIAQDITTPSAGIQNNSGTTLLSCGVSFINVVATGGVSYLWDGGLSTTTSINSLFSPGNYTVVVTAANGCTSSSGITIFLPHQSDLINGPAVICQGGSATFTAVLIPGITSYLWTSSSTSISIVSGQGSNIVTANFDNNWDVGFLTVYGILPCGADTLGTAIHMRSVPGTPSLIQGPGTVCINSIAAYSVSTMPGFATSFVWSVPVGMSITSGVSTNSISVSTNSAWSGGTIAVHAVNSCGVGVDRTLLVKSVPNQPGLISGSATICKNSSANYSVATVSGVTYTWVAPTGMNITSGLGTNSVNVVTLNTWTAGTISVTANNSCGSSPARTLSPKSLPSTPGTISGQSTGICQGSSATYSVASTSGVIYSWVAPTGSSISSGQGSNIVSVDYSLSFPSSGTLSVYGTNDCGASTVRNLSVSGSGSVPASPGTVSTNINSGICPGENRMYSVSPTNGVTYSWAVPSGASIASGQTTNQIVVNYTNSFTASGIVSVIAVNSCGNGPSSSIGVSPGTAPSIPGTISVDISDGICPASTRNYNIASIANASGYNWTAPNGATITAGQGTNSIGVTYGGIFTSGNIVVTAFNNCGSSSPKTLSVSPGLAPSSPAGISSNAAGTTCSGDSRTYSVTFTAGVTYFWTTPPGGNIAGGQGSNIITVSYDDNFTSTGTVSITAQNSCGMSGAASLSIVHGPAPANTGAIIANIGGGVCPNDSRIYSVPFVSGVAYNWTAPAASNIVSGQNTNVITVSYVGFSSTDTVRVTTSNLCGISQPSVLAVQPHTPVSAPGTISGYVSVCPNSSQIYSVVSVNGVTYTWTTPPNASIISGQGSNLVNISFSGAFTSSGNLTVTANNGCDQSASSTLSISSNNAASGIGTIAGNVLPCIGSTYAYSVSQVNGTTYAWTAPSGATILTGQGTNSVTVKFPATFTAPGNLSVTANTVCGSVATTLNITPNNIPAQPNTIAGTSVACNGDQITYSVTAVTNASTYIWTLPSGCSGTSNSNSIQASYGSGFTGGNVTVKPSNACGTGLVRSKGIVTGTAPSQPGSIIGATAVCNGSYLYSVGAVTGANSYLWTLPSGSSGSSSANSISITYGNTFTGGNISVAAVACGSSIASSIIISTGSAPASTSTISGPVSECAGATASYSVTFVNGVTYNWIAPPGASIVGGQGSSSATVNFSATFTSSGNLTVTAGNGCGQSSPTTLNISPNNTGPVVGAISGSDLPCTGSTYPYSVTSVSGVTYSWTAPSGATILTGQVSNNVSVKFTSVFASGNLCVNASTACGSVNTWLTITANSAPAQPSTIYGSSAVCPNSQVLYSVTPINNATSYIWTLPAQSNGNSSDSYILLNYGGSFSSGTISVKAVNACGTGLVRSKGISLATSCGTRMSENTAGNNAEESISVYPNPAREQFSINYFNNAESNQYHLTLVDMIGREVVIRNGTVVEGENIIEIELAGITKGVYMVHFSSGNSDKVMRLVIE